MISPLNMSISCYLCCSEPRTLHFTSSTRVGFSMLGHGWDTIHRFGPKFWKSSKQIAESDTWTRNCVGHGYLSPSNIGCYHLIISLHLCRLENRLSKRNKFLYRMRVYHKDLLPPKIIAGNQFTMISQHQIAAIEYLEAYKQMPENPLINLCTGMQHL